MIHNIHELSEDQGYDLKAVLYHEDFVARVYYDPVTDGYIGELIDFPEDMLDYYDYVSANEPELLEFRISELGQMYSDFIDICTFFLSEYEYPGQSEEDDEYIQHLRNIISKDQSVS